MTRSALAPASQQPTGGPPDRQGARLLSIAAGSYDATSRTVEAVFASGYRVRRFFGFEELAITREAIDLSRVTGGVCPLLNAHNQYEVGAVLGTVESARIENGRLVGRLRFADTPAAQEAEQMVARGELRGISVGYQVRTWKLIEEAEDGAQVWRADSWELMEVSLAPVPADPVATIRSEEIDVTRTATQSSTPPAVDPGAAAPSALRSAVSALAITQACRNAGLDTAAVEELQARHESSPFTRDGLMTEIGARYAARDTPVTTVNRNSAAGDRHPILQLAERMEGALFARMSGQAPSDSSREFMSIGLPNMARMLMEQSGHQVRHLNDYQVMEIAMHSGRATAGLDTRASHTTSDFPNLLINAGNRFLINIFEAAQSDALSLAREREAPDFRPMSGIQLSEFGKLDKINESGEFKFGTFTERAETYKAELFGKIFNLSLHALVNDSLGAFADPLQLMARAAAETQADQVVQLLTANSGDGAAMADGKTLYHAGHGNKAVSGAIISQNTLSEARAAMRLQKDVSGQTFMNVAPRYIVVGADNESAAQQYCAIVNAVEPGKVNPFQGKLETKVDPRLPAASWRLFGDPSQSPVIEHAYLSGYKGPQLASREGWEVAGMQFKVALMWGCGLVDWRGTYLNPGE